MSKFLELKNTRPAQNELIKFHSYSSIFALGLFVFLVANLFWYAPISHVDFYDELWGPAHLLLQGKSPYDTSSLNPMQPAAWFPMAIGFYFPLGWLSEEIATQVWLIINIIEICVIIYIAQGESRTLYNTVILAALCFFFPPTLHHFALGQISVSIVLWLVLAIHFVDKDQQWMAAFLIALAFSKPHMAILPTLGLCYYYFLRRPGAVFSFLGKVLVMALLLCMPLFVAFPKWIPDAIVSMSKNPSWQHPSLFVFFPKHLGPWGYVAWGLIVVVVLIFCYFQWRHHSPRDSMYWSLALAPLISPYIGSWDFVVLFPLLILTFSQADWKRKIFLMLSYAVAWRLMALVQMQNSGLNYFFWWVPLWFIGTIILVFDWKNSKIVNGA